MNTPAKSGRMRRAKGVRGEREVALAFERGGMTVRGLEGQGDHLVVLGPTLTLHVESKRQERIEIDRWSHQAEAEAPQGTVPIVAYRRSREPWRVALLLDDLIALITWNDER